MATGSAPPEHGRGPRGAPSLRTRLAATIAAVVMTVALGQATVVYVTTEHAEESMIDDLLEEQLERSIAVYRTRPEDAFPNTPTLTLYVPGDPASPALPDWLRDVPAGDARMELEPSPGVEVHVAVRREGDRVFYLVYDVEIHEQRRRDSLAILMASVIASALLGMLAARGLAGRLLGDLDRLANAVRGRVGTTDAPGTGSGPDGPAAAATTMRAGPDRPDERVAFSTLAEHAETLTLARALDDEHARVRAAIARERAFAAAANHELRTPLMQASSTLELLEASRDEAARQALMARLAAAHAELRSLTEALLRVARGRTTESMRDCALETLVDGIVARTADDARARRITVVGRVPAGAHARVDPGSLEIVLLNLVRNAIRHSGGTRVEIGYEGGALWVDDDGEGQGAGAAAAPAQAGTGLGLSIVERVCEANGWHWTVGRRHDRGTRACVRLEGASLALGAPASAAADARIGDRAR